ncbi:peptidase family c78 protein [Ceratobasidium sp. AG-Ba]|nr:peptidase family c78 protein [Ceratobasidium sp. AG-Ba]
MVMQMTWPPPPVVHTHFLDGGKAHTALIQWLTAHFLEHTDSRSGPNSTRGVFMSRRMPIVLQHKGHSRTVVGLEFAPSGETNVLIYDPARRPSPSLRKAGLGVHAANISGADPHSTAVDSPTVEQDQHGRLGSSPSKAKGFLKRVIKKQPDDWEAMGKGKERRLGGEDGDHGANTNGGHGEDAPVADVARGLDLGRVLGAFRVSASQLGKKDQYQILWFPMTPALSGSERDALKVVRSERVTVSPVSGS